jgi:hypothetical protein
MGIFDVFKTKVKGAADKAGDMAGDAKGKDTNAPADSQTAQDSAAGMPGTAATDQPGPEAGGMAPDPTKDEAQEAAHMVSEGGPIAETGEAAPGIGDDGATTGQGEARRGEDGRLTGTIKQNLSSGADKRAGMADSATGGKYSDPIQKAADKAKDNLG